jgi:hypothetical protein
LSQQINHAKVFMSVSYLVLAAVFAMGTFARARAADAPEQGMQKARALAARARELPPVGSEPGLSYTNLKVPAEPWSIHVLKVDRSRKDLGFYSAHARDKVLAVSYLADQARAVPSDLGRAIAAINGDFYLRDNPTYAGDPRGLQIINGELISAPDTVCVWFDTNGNPHLDEVNGDFKVTWPDGSTTAIGLNQQRSSTGAAVRQGGVPPGGGVPVPAVLFTPTYGTSTRSAGGREFILEKVEDSPWLPLQVGKTLRSRVREISENGNTRLAAGTMVLSLSPQLLSTVPEVKAGAVLKISTATTPDLNGVKAALGGGPALVKEGRAIFTTTTPPPGISRDWSQRSKYERHPRSAVGWNATHLFLVTVDGRQPGLSMGMKLAELADLFMGFGCTEAMNFDGGKSAQLWVSGQIVNSPCQREDTVANSLLVLRKP